MRVEDQCALGVFARRVTRTIYGEVQMVDGTWRRRMHHELHLRLREPTVGRITKIARLR
ncbi:hypothetical protein RP20_CCG008122 [Aedes albopictus]|nr:hypothetical protein RP20_CCG008122 [Aedes albopictus]